MTKSCFTNRGETISTYSTDVKNMNNETGTRKKIGDKVDFRVILRGYNVDLLNGEIASNTTGTKYFHDSRKNSERNKKHCRSILSFSILK